MKLTERFGLIKQSQDDFYDIDNHNANVAALEAQAMKGVGVLNCLVMLAEEYDALELKDTQTLYLVINNNRFSLYLGEIPLEGGGVPSGDMTVNMDGTAATAVTGEIEEV